MVCQVLFDFYYQCNISGLSYFVQKFGNNNTLLMCVCNGLLFVFIFYCICTLLCTESALEFTTTLSFILIYTGTIYASAIRRLLCRTPACHHPPVSSVIFSTCCLTVSLASVSLDSVSLASSIRSPSMSQEVPSLPYPQDQISG